MFILSSLRGNRGRNKKGERDLEDDLSFPFTGINIFKTYEVILFLHFFSTRCRLSYMKTKHTAVARILLKNLNIKFVDIKNHTSLDHIKGSQV